MLDLGLGVVDADRGKGYLCQKIGQTPDSLRKWKGGVTFFAPILLARLPPTPDFRAPRVALGALARRPFPKISEARASFFFF